jgi:hypothetical protein
MSRAVAAASVGAVVSSATPNLLLPEWTGGAGIFILVYGLGITFWIAFHAALRVTNQWAALRAPAAKPELAALIVSLVYPVQWYVVYPVARGQAALVMTSVVGAASICAAVALISRAWHWPALLAMLAWSVVSVSGNLHVEAHGPGWPRLETVPEWLWFLVRWQVPEAALAAVWLVRAHRRREAALRFAASA